MVFYKKKNFDGVFTKNNVKNKNCGIINLDYPHGPGTHWTCYINNMYFDPFDPSTTA